MLYGLSIINGYFSNLGELKNVFKIESSDLNDQPLFGPEKGYHQLPENKGNFKREFPFGYSFLYDENREKDKKDGLIGMTFRLWQICAMARCLIL